MNMQRSDTAVVFVAAVNEVQGAVMPCSVLVDLAGYNARNLFILYTAHPSFPSHALTFGILSLIKWLHWEGVSLITHVKTRCVFV